ncbi:MAG: hypothetical protein ACI80P_001940, partial [Flavobacteriales bacterium]
GCNPLKRREKKMASNFSELETKNLPLFRCRFKET